MSVSIALVNPPYLKNYSRQSRSPCVAKSGTIYFSYYLAYAGCAAELASANVTYIDSIAFELDFDVTLSRISESSPGVVVVDTSTPSIISDIAFASKIKEHNPHSLVFCSGTFPSKNTSDFFDLVQNSKYQIDGCFIGEYEEIVYDLCRNLDSWKSISGIAYLVDDSSIYNHDVIARKTSVSFLGQLPFVSDFYLRHLGERGIKRHFYASITWPYIQILTSRGCPFKCSFCNIPSIGSYRKRSIDSIVAELRFIKNNLSFVNEIFIEDDTFPIDKKRTISLCKAIIDEGLNITWSCNARVDTDPEALLWMKKAGCRLTCVGFESPTSNALDGVIKKTSLEQQEVFMEEANKIGIKVNGCFILGLHGDTPETIQSTIEYSKKLMPNTAQFYPHMVYPGTGSFEWAEDNNLLEHKDWTKWNTSEGFHNTPLKINGLSSADLLNLADKARKEFYTNPKYIFKMFFQSLSSFREFQRMIIASKSFFPLLISYIFSSKK